MLVLDANILIRAVLGSRVLSLLRKYGVQIDFLAPDAAFSEARRRLPDVLARQRVAVEPAFETLDLVESLVQTIESDIYLPFEAVARLRIERRDVNDRPILADDLAVESPIWTEDTDFFGCGVATWTTDRVELYLGEISRK